MQSMTTAVNTMSQLQKQFDIISHNIANAQTNGYKRRDVSFSDMIFQQINNQPSPDREVGRNTPYGIRQGVGASLSASSMILKLGSIRETGRTLDAAFTEPNQLLKVVVQEGGEQQIRFTRNGALHLTPTGNNELMLVTDEGHPVLDSNENMIVFSDQFKNFTITKDGTFRAMGATGQIAAELGVIALNKPQFMEQKSGTLIGLPENPTVAPESIYTELNGAARNTIAIQQGALEGSNVDLSKEMTDMMNVQRALQFQSRSFSLSDQMMGLVNGIR